VKFGRRSQIPLFGHKQAPTAEARLRVLESLRKGPVTGEVIEASFAEQDRSGLRYDSQNFRIEDVLKALQREGKIEFAVRDGTRIYYLTGDGLLEIVGSEEQNTSSTSTKVVRIVLEEILTATKSWSGRDTLP